MNFAYFFAFIVGACLGSFANVLIWRLPKEQSVVSPVSHCTHCETPLRFMDMIPIVSYIFLKGKCRTCGSTISIRYPITETVIAIASVILFTMYGFTSRYVIELLLVTSLYTVTLIDAKHRIIPDEISLFLMAFGVLSAPWNPMYSVSGVWGIVHAVGGLCVGLGLLWLIAFVGEKLFSQEALGGGDIKLFGGIGAVCGAQAVLEILMYASVLAAVGSVVLLILGIKHRRDTIAFGPFISIGCVVWLYTRKYLAFL